MPWPALLVPTDFSEEAEHAARLASRLGRAQSGSHLDVVHVASPPIPPAAWSPWPGQPVPAIVTQNVPPVRRQEERLASWAARCELDAESQLVRIGTPGPEIVQLARERRVDLIVMGARGAGLWQRVLLGTTATSVIHDAPCDVLVVRGAPRLERILVGIDYSPNAERAAQDAAWLGERFGSQVLLVHVRDTSLADGPVRGDEADPRLASLNERVFHGRAGVLDAEGNPASALRSVAQEHGVDLLAVGAHRGGLLGRILLGDTARALVHDAPCSVLVARAG